MIRHFLMGVVSLLIAAYSHGQGFTEHWAFTAGGSANDSANCVAVGPQGEVYVGGGFRSATLSAGSISLTNASSNSDAFVIKLDSLGNVSWAKRFGGTGDEKITALKFHAGFLYAVGTNFQLAKMDNGGNLIWQLTTGADNYSTIAIDEWQNIYTGNYKGFRKYKSDGLFLYARTVPHYIESGDFSLDWANQPHIFFHANGGTVTDGVQTYSVNLATRVVYDTSGKIKTVQPVSNNLPRWYPVGYKATGINNYYATTHYPTLNVGSGGAWYMALGQNITGQFGYGGCYEKRPINPETDGLGSQAYAGTIRPFGPCSVQPILAISPTNQINTITGSDIFYIHRIVNKDTGNTTYGNGNTNETALRMTIDSVRKVIYITGFWSKLSDTSKFRFGPSTLTNAGNGSSSDVLLLALKYSDISLRASAGFDRSICYGGSLQLLASASGGTGNYSYSWSPATGLNNASVANPIASPLSSTNYVLTITDGAGNTARDTVIISVNPSLYKPTIQAFGVNPFCEGGQVILSTAPAQSYQWSSRSSGGSATNSITIATSDTVTVTTTNSEGCIGSSDPYITVMKMRTPTPIITPAGNLQNTINACAGTLVTLTAQNAQNPVTYLWNTGATTSSLAVQTAGVYSVTATGANGCTSLLSSRNVVYNSPPTGSISASGNTVICSGDSVQLTVNTTATNSVLWSTGAIAKSIWVKIAGTYSVQLTSPQGCTGMASNPVTVQVNQRPTASITQNGNTLTAMPASASYQWYLNNNAIAGATAQTLNITVGGNYSVQVTDANGCSATTAYGAVLRISSSALAYQVYPNPARDKIGIVYTLQQSERVTITIKNAQGQIIKTVVNGNQQSTGSHQYTVSTQGLPKGLVIIEFRIDDKTVKHKQLIM